MARMKAKDVIQRHHNSYEPEIVDYVRRTEHHILTVMQRMTTPTKGFLHALEFYIWQWKGKAISGLKYKESYAKASEEVKILGNKFKKLGRHIK